MEIKRMAIGFFVILIMAFSLSVVSNKTDQTNFMAIENKNKQITGFEAQ